MTWTLDNFVDEVRKRLMPAQGYAESEKAYRLRCPSGECRDSASFILSRSNGSGVCMNELLPEVGDFRRYSPWVIARLLGMDVCGSGIRKPPRYTPSFSGREFAGFTGGQHGHRGHRPQAAG